MLRVTIHEERHWENIEGDVDSVAPDVASVHDESFTCVYIASFRHRPVYDNILYTADSSRVFTFGVNGVNGVIPFYSAGCVENDIYWTAVHTSLHQSEAPDEHTLDSHVIYIQG